MTDDSAQRADADSARRESGPFKPYRTILEQEIVLAEEELERPAHGLAVSGLIAGFGIGASLLLVAALMAGAGGTPTDPVAALVLGSAYSAGFILVILGRTDLFTEYTTLAILPVLVEHAPLRQLARLWGIVYTTNLIGAALFAAALAWIGPAHGMVDAAALHDIAARLTAVDAQAALVSAVLAGWLMGLLSWLIAAARDTTSQILFIWVVGTTIGVGHLHHSILGSAEVLAGVLSSPTLSAADYGRFVLWSTLGNAAGGVAFAILIRYGMIIGRGTGHHRAQRRDR